MLSLFLLSINIFFGFLIIPLTHVLFKGLEHIKTDIDESETPLEIGKRRECLVTCSLSMHFQRCFTMH